MALPKSVRQSFMDNDMVAFDAAFNTFPYHDRGTICQPLINFALDTNSFVSLRSSLEDTSRGIYDPMWQSVQNSRHYTEIVHGLLETGFSPNYNPNWSSSRILTDAIEDDNIPFLQLLLEYGATINSDNPYLEEASTSVLEALRKHDAVMRDNMPLHMAALKGDVELMKSLIRSGMDINQMPDKVNFPRGFQALGMPLHYAAQGRHMNAVLLLLNEGADATARDVKGRSIIERSREQGMVWNELFKMMEERGISV